MPISCGIRSVHVHVTVVTVVRCCGCLDVVVTQLLLLLLLTGVFVNANAFKIFVGSIWCMNILYSLYDTNMC